MKEFWQTQNILILGGDRREVDLYYYLKALGAAVFIFGFEKFDVLQEEKIVAEELEEIVSLCDVIITPLSGINVEGEIYAPFAAEKILLPNSIRPNTLFLAGHLHSYWKTIFFRKSVSFIETSYVEDVSIYGAIPTAEGAIQYAMMNTDITIHNSQSFVLGFGRCGKVIAKTLRALGAEVTVTTRKKEGVMAWIEALKMKPLLLKDLHEEIGRADIVFNTIPAIVIDEVALQNMKRDSLIIDIASYPGGVAATTAQNLGIRNINLPGLPGKVAPKTAGKILCRVYLPLIYSILKGGESK